MSGVQRVHCIGIGGIHVSAVAKLLLARGVSVSGSDAFENDETRDVRARGADVAIGHAAKNLPAHADVVVYTHAVPDNVNSRKRSGAASVVPIRTHSSRRLFEGARQVVVTGSHGKSTTTSMLGLILAACGADPTVVVGTKCAGFPDGNLRIGRDDLLVVEGDEYQRHVLSYAPTVLVLNNVELDHVDVYPTVEAYAQVFADVAGKMAPGGTVIVNADDARASEIGRKANDRGLAVIGVGRENGDVRIGRIESQDGGSTAEIVLADGNHVSVDLIVPGEMNVRNAVMAIVGARASEPNLNFNEAQGALAGFTGCWRRFERIGSINGAVAISDYGHHPTEVAATLAAAKSAYPDRRVILAFQPHHRNRTRHLFDAFVPSFDGADILLLVEIYDVPGRESLEDAGVSSAQLAEAARKRDVSSGKTRTIEFVSTPDALRDAIRAVDSSEKDVVIFMGAGSIDAAARGIVQSAIS